MTPADSLDPGCAACPDCGARAWRYFDGSYSTGVSHPDTGEAESWYARGWRCEECWRFDPA